MSTLTKEDVVALFEELSTKLVANIRDSIERNLKSVIEKKFSVIFKKIDEVRSIANDASSTAKWCEGEITAIKDTHTNELTALTTKIEQFENDHISLRNELDKISIKANVAEEKLEEQINRSSRKSLVFRGIPESGRESWADTKNILSDMISAHSDVSPKEAFEMVERCHRSSFTTRTKKGTKGCRVIYALFRDWEDSQYVLGKFRSASIRGESNGVSASQKYGIITTARRNNALLVRKQLKKDGVIAQGYVEYPAKLLVKYRSTDAKFVLHDDFSDMEVTPRQQRRSEDED